MPIKYEELMAMKNLGQKYSYGDREVMLYAYGIGMGADPMDEKELAFVNEAVAASWMNRLSSRPSWPSANRTNPSGSSTSVRSAAIRAIASSSLASAETISASQNFTFSASPRLSNAAPPVTTSHPWAVSS